MDIASIGQHPVAPASNGPHAAHLNGAGSAAPPAAAARLEGLESAPAVASNGAVDVLRSRDRIEISGHARLLDQLRQMPDVRMERVEAIREAIARGAYETQDRFDGAVERLMVDLQG